MILKTIDIKNDNSMDYAALHMFLWEYTPKIAFRKRPMIIVCPGGGYAYTSDREADSIAMQFVAMGYHAAVLRYSVAPAVFPTALLELGRAVALIREHAEEWNVEEERIAICGFSAGGHLAGSFGVFWNKQWLRERLGVSANLICPNALILGYPVITAGEFAHRGSFENLLGADCDARKEELSLEKLVHPDVPRTFIWNTAEDGSVPVQNSLLMVNALLEKHVPVEYHMFETGCHGLALANRLTAGESGKENNPAAAVWTQLVHTWLENWILA